MKYFVIFMILINANISQAKNDIFSFTFIKGQNEYNDLVQKAEEEFEIGLYKLSEQHLIEASSIRFYDSPNYLLYSVLSHVNLLMGNIKLAKKYIGKSEIIVKLISNIYKCREKNNGIFIIEFNNKPLNENEAKEVAKLMCGGSFSYIYNSTFKNLSRVVLDGKIVEYHLKVKKLINMRLSNKQKKEVKSLVP